MTILTILTVKMITTLSVILITVILLNFVLHGFMIKECFPKKPKLTSMSIGDIIQSGSYLINILIVENVFREINQILCPISTALLMLLGFASISH